MKNGNTYQMGWDDTRIIMNYASSFIYSTCNVPIFTFYISVTFVHHPIHTCPLLNSISPRSYHLSPTPAPSPCGSSPRLPPTCCPLYLLNLCYICPYMSTTPIIYLLDHNVPTTPPPPTCFRAQSVQPICELCLSGSHPPPGYASHPTNHSSSQSQS